MDRDLKFRLWYVRSVFGGVQFVHHPEITRWFVLNRGNLILGSGFTPVAALDQAHDRALVGWV